MTPRQEEQDTKGDDNKDLATWPVAVCGWCACVSGTGGGLCSLSVCVADVIGGVWLVWLVGDVVGVAGIRYGVSLPNRTETPQCWQYVNR